MQTTIYYKKQDNYLIENIEEKAKRERKSKSAVILSILEDYFEAEKKIGEILSDIGAVRPEDLNKALSRQQNGKVDKRLGEILVEEDKVREIDLDRALQIQNR